MALLDLLGKGLTVVGSLLGGDSKVNEAVNTVAAAIAGDPKVQEQIKQLEVEERKLWIQENESIRQLFQVEAKSEDAFVRRARPAMLWLVFALLAVNFGLLPIVNAFTVAFGGDAITFAFPELPEQLYWLIGSLFGLYTGARSWDKRTKAKNGGR